MKRSIRSIQLLVAGVMLSGSSISVVQADPTPAKPNIIFILADDLGYGDVGVTFQNSRDPSKPRFTTPNLDHMAAGGMLLGQHYSGSPVCAPARASLLTGQHQGDCAIRDNQFDKALPTNHTLATVLKASGYTTIAIGKWGLQGSSPDYPGHPLRHGFDAFFGFLAHSAGHAYYHDAAHPLHDGFNDVTDQYTDIYSTDLFTARAKKFLVEHQAHAPQQPFFMYLAYTAPHFPEEVPGNAYPAGAGLNGGLQWPLSPTHETRDKWYYPEYASKKWGDRMKRYATVIHRLDQCVGDVSQTLRDLKIDQNTLVVFTSDNGPSNEGIDPRRFDSWGPFDGFKRDVWEGGVREPTIVSWPGHISAGRVSQFVSSFWDWMPTFADAAGLAPPAQADGVSLLPLLTGAAGQRSRGFIYEDYFFSSPPHPNGPLADVYARKHVTGRGVQQMLREGDLVAIRTQVEHPDDPLRLYNVVLDPHEDHNLADDPQYAPMLKKMRDDLAGVRRPDKEAPRPYDQVLIPSVDAAVQPHAIDVDLYQGSWPWVPDFDALQPTQHLTIASLKDLPITDNSGTKLSGYLNLPTDGTYTFWLTDDDGAQLWLHQAHVIDDDFNHDGSTITANVNLKSGLHPFHLFYRHAQGASKLKFEFAGPGIDRQEIPADLFAAPVAATTKP